MLPDSSTMTLLLHSLTSSIWNSSTPYCSWTGVFCHSLSHHVTGIDLSHSNLHGPLSPSFANLSLLTYLNASSNSLSGPIPPQFQLLSSLLHLDLSRNLLHGDCPPIFHAMPSLLLLNLAHNKLAGPLPHSLQTCINLTFLSLETNRLTGNESLTILTKLTSLKQVYLANNRLAGSIPPDIKELLNLQILDLEGNYFRGAIPNEIEYLQKLDILNIGKNSLSGELPAALGNCTNLRVLKLHENSLTGPIPSTIGQIFTLAVLNLGENYFSLTIPTSIAHCSRLQELNLHGNRLDGSIPAELGSLTALAENLDLSSNSFTGQIPAELGNLAFLRRMDLSANMLTGEIPSSLGNCQSLLILNLSKNNLSGTIPSTCGNLAKLEDLNLCKNKLNGSLSKEFGQLVVLTSLDLSVNRLSGIVPASFSSLVRLEYFNISQNMLVGQIPNTPTFRGFDSSAFANNSGFCGWISAVECPQVSPSSAPQAASNKNAEVTISSLVVVTIVLLLLGFAFWRYLLKRHPELFSAPSDGTFTAKALSTATENFNTENLIGEGKHYMVFKGHLGAGRTVAVKRLRQEFHENDGPAFAEEWAILAKMQHPNLVSVLGWCSSSGLSAVVSAIMSNGSLEQQLHETGGLHWDLRFRIVAGVANGLAYLHQQCLAELVLHCDLTPESILLDENFEPHLSAYKIMSFRHEQAAASKSDAFSFGYRAPECAYGAARTANAEIYSYGVIVLELITGKKPDAIFIWMKQSIVEWVSRSFSNNAWDVVDPVVKGTNIDPEQILYLMEMALRCTDIMPDRRPPMAEVLSMIQNLASRRNQQYGAHSHIVKAANFQYQNQVMESSSKFANEENPLDYQQEAVSNIQSVSPNFAGEHQPLMAEVPPMINDFAFVENQCNQPAVCYPAGAEWPSMIEEPSMLNNLVSAGNQGYDVHANVQNKEDSLEVDTMYHPQIQSDNQFVAYDFLGDSWNAHPEATPNASDETPSSVLQSLSIPTSLIDGPVVSIDEVTARVDMESSPSTTQFEIEEGTQTISQW